MSFRRIMILFILLEIFIVFLGWWQYDLTLLALQSITRYSGRLSLLLFSFIFLLHTKPDTLSEWLSPYYYFLFAVVHGIHLVELLFYISVSDQKLVFYRLAGGTLAYMLVFTMPILFRSYTLGRIKAHQFRILENVYVYYIWFIFFMTYLPRVQGKLPQTGGSYVEYVALLGWVSILLGFKLAGLFRFR